MGEQPSTDAAESIAYRGQLYARLSLVWLAGLGVLVAIPSWVAKLNASAGARTVMLLISLAAIFAIYAMGRLAWRHCNAFFSGSGATQRKWRLSLQYVGPLAAWAYWLCGAGEERA